MPLPFPPFQTDPSSFLPSNYCYPNGDILTYHPLIHSSFTFFIDRCGLEVFTERPGAAGQRRLSRACVNSAHWYERESLDIYGKRELVDNNDFWKTQENEAHTVLRFLDLRHLVSASRVIGSFWRVSQWAILVMPALIWRGSKFRSLWLRIGTNICTTMSQVLFLTFVSDSVPYLELFFFFFFCRVFQEWRCCARSGGALRYVFRL